MLILGLVLLLIGWLASIAILVYIGAILAVIGAVLMFTGGIGGRRLY